MECMKMSVSQPNMQQSTPEGIRLRKLMIVSVSVAARPQAQVYGCSSAEIVGSNPTVGMDVCCECCVLSGRGLCDELITRPEDSYRL